MSSSSVATGLEDRHNRVFDISTRRRRYEEVEELLVVWGNQSAAVLAVPVQQPTTEQKRSALVALAEGLRPRDAVHQDTCGGHHVLDVGDGIESSAETIKVVGLVEPLVVVADCSIDRDSERYGRPNQ